MTNEIDTKISRKGERLYVSFKQKKTLCRLIECELRDDEQVASVEELSELLNVLRC